MVRVEQNDDGVTGIALAASLGLGLGLVGGILLGDLFGNVDSERVKRAVGRLAASRAGPVPDPELVEHAVRSALDENADTFTSEIHVVGLGDGIVELTGTAPDAMARQLAGDIARGVQGAEVVVNRILVAGSDRFGPLPSSTPSAG